MIPIEHIVILSIVLFSIGCIGFLTRKNLLVIFMSIELMLNAVNINLVAFSCHLNSLRGKVFVIFIITVAAAEAVVGIIILIAFYRNKGTFDVNEASEMRG